MADNDDEYIDDCDDDIDLETVSEPGTVAAHILLPAALLKEHFNVLGLAEIRTRECFCLVIEAPAPDWVQPLIRCIRSFSDWDFAHQVNVAPKRPPSNDDVTPQNMMKALSSGGRCLGVSHDLKLLPEGLLAAADMVEVLPFPSKKIIAAVISEVCGRGPVDLIEADFNQLSFGEIVSCIRRGSSPAECVDRMRRAMACKNVADAAVDQAPPIEALHGYGAAQEWALELVQDLEAWRRGEIPFEAASAHVVLASPPGMGKTTFMRSLARSTGLPLFATTVGEWFSNSPGYLDSVIKQIDAVFTAARDAAPAIVFLDEVDAVPNRATLSPRGADWWLPVITHLLTTLDGAVSGKTKNLVIVGATNHPEKLDPALIRPGRLSRVIHIELPDEEALVGIFRQHLNGDLEGEDLSHVASFALGATGAVVVEYVKNARRRARAAKRPMLLNDLEAAVTPDETRSADLVRHIAIHEAGHAALAHATGYGRILGISIVQSGDTGGFVSIDNDGRLPTKSHLEKAIIHRLGGRAAEQAILGVVGSGSGGSGYSDLAVATRQVALMHLSLGMGDTLAYRGDEAGVDHLMSFDPKTNGVVEAELQRLYVEAVALAKQNADLIEAVAEELIARRHIGPSGFLEIVDRVNGARQRKESNNG